MTSLALRITRSAAGKRAGIGSRTSLEQYLASRHYDHGLWCENAQGMTTQEKGRTFAHTLKASFSHFKQVFGKLVALISRLSAGLCCSRGWVKMWWYGVSSHTESDNHLSTVHIRQQFFLCHLISEVQTSVSNEASCS
jgi:hypothetical protein